MIWAVVTVACVIGALTVLVLILRWRYLVIRVTGFSMVPTLYPGDRVLVRRAGLRGLRTGQIVVLRDWPEGSADPDHERSPDAMTWFIKRLAAAPGDPVPEAARASCGGARTVPTGMVIVLSENNSGIDSRQRGFASASQLIGYVISPLQVARPAQPGIRRAAEVLADLIPPEALTAIIVIVTPHGGLMTVYVGVACRSLLIGVFAYSAVAKLRNGAEFRRFRSWLRALPLPVVRRHASVVSVAMVGTELAVVALLALPWTGLAGFALATAALAAFVAGTVIAILRGSTEPCECFGTSGAPLAMRHIARDAALLAAAVAGAIASGGHGARPGGIAVSVASALVVAVLMVSLDDVLSLFGAMPGRGPGVREFQG